MKRSKMLDLIHKKLDGIPYNSNWEEQILSAVEELGMLPPEYVIPATHDDVHYVMKNPNWDGKDPSKEYIGAIKINEWEPEDE